MIHIVGTRHSLQCWSDAIRNGEDCDADLATVGRFKHYLQDVAGTLHATVCGRTQPRICGTKSGRRAGRKTKPTLGEGRGNRRQQDDLAVCTNGCWQLVSWPRARKA